MPNRNAIRFTLALSLALAGSAFAQDAKTQITQKYHTFDTMILANKGGDVLHWFEENATPDFFYVSRDHNKFLRSQFVQMVKQQIAATQKVTEASTKVVSVMVKGTSATVQTESSTKALILIDGKSVRLTDKDKTTDVWSLTKGKWLIKSSVQSWADTKMDAVDKSLVAGPLFGIAKRTAQQLEDTAHHGIGQIFQGLRPVIPGGACGQNGSSGFGKGGQVAQHDDVHRHLSGHHDEGAALLQAYVGRTCKKVVGNPVCDATRGTHRAWDDNHPVVPKGTACGWREVVAGVQKANVGEFLAEPIFRFEVCALGSHAKFGGRHLDGLIAKDQQDFVVHLRGAT